MSDGIPVITNENENSVILDKLRESEETAKEFMGESPDLFRYAGYGNSQLMRISPTVDLLKETPTYGISKQYGGVFSIYGDPEDNRCEIHTSTFEDSTRCIHIGGIRPGDSVLHDGIDFEVILTQLPENTEKLSPFEVFETAMWARFGGVDQISFKDNECKNMNWEKESAEILFCYPWTDLFRTNPMKTYRFGFIRIIGVKLSTGIYDAHIRTVNTLTGNNAITQDPFSQMANSQLVYSF